MNKQEKGLHFVTGEKGGVGKSLWSMVLLEYLHSQQIAYEFFDTDRTSPDVGLIYQPEQYKASSENSTPSYQPDNQPQQKQVRVYFSEDEEDVFLADFLLEKASQKLVLVNLPAQVTMMVDRWLQQRAILNLASEEGINITFWFVTDGSPESLNLLRQSLLNYRTEIDHIVVLNQGLNKRVVGNISSHSVSEAIGSYAVSTLTLPLLSLSSEEKKLLKTERIELGKASDRHHQSPLTLIAKQRIKQFLKQSHQEISKLGIFSDEKAVHLN